MTVGPAADAVVMTGKLSRVFGPISPSPISFAVTPSSSRSIASPAFAQIELPMNALSSPERRVIPLALNAIAFAAAAVSPPMRLNDDPNASPWTPLQPFPRSSVPATFVPMAFAWIVLLFELFRLMPRCVLPAMTLPLPRGTDDRATRPALETDTVEAVGERCRGGQVRADRVAENLCPGCAGVVDVDPVNVVSGDQVVQDLGAGCTFDPDAVQVVRDGGIAVGVGSDAVVLHDVATRGSTVDENSGFPWAIARDDVAVRRRRTANRVRDGAAVDVDA